MRPTYRQRGCVAQQLVISLLGSLICLLSLCVQLSLCLQCTTERSEYMCECILYFEHKAQCVAMQLSECLIPFMFSIKLMVISNSDTYTG